MVDAERAASGRPQRALVTGASSGIGAALARRMAARGVEVWLGARRMDRLTHEVAAIEAAGGKAHAVVIDVTRPDEAEAAVLAVDDACGGLDVVVANAGIGGRGRPASATTWRDVAECLATNTTGALATLLPLVPRMIERGSGHLVGISSVAAELPLPSAPDYGASKAALTFFLQCAQGDLPKKGVDVTVVHPGFVKSDLTAKNKFRMPFLLETEEGARLIDEGIQRRARLVRFPLGLLALVALGKALPASVKDAVVSRQA
jgi:short-subunit dehydrogenase